MMRVTNVMREASKKALRHLSTATPAVTATTPGVVQPSISDKASPVKQNSALDDYVRTATNSNVKEGAVAGLQPWQLALDTNETPLFANQPHLKDLLVKPDYKPIQPLFWMGQNAVHESKWQIDASRFDFGKIIIPKEGGGWQLDRNCKEFEELHGECEGLYKELGIYHLVNTGLTEKAKIGTLADIVFEQATNYHGGSNYRGKVLENVFDTGAPITANILMHHEMAYVGTSVKYVQFMAMEAPHLGSSGATFASHNETAHKFYMEHLGEKAAKKGICYVRKLPDLEFYLKNGGDPRAVYNYWQTSFHTEDPEEATEEARKTGLEVEWQDSKIYGRYMVTKYYTSAFEYDPFHDANRLYGSIADSHEWFDTWPGVRELCPEERPLALTWGDDEPTTHEERMLWSKAYDLGGCKIEWKKGDAAFLCNYRWAHGRPAIKLKPGEKREIGVRLGEVLNRQGARADKGFD